MNDKVPVATEIADLLPQLANNRAFWRAWGGQPPESAAEDISVYRSGIQHGLLNGVLRASGSDIAAAAEMAQTELRGVPWTWWCESDSAPGTAEALLSLGAQEHSPIPVMAFDLSRTPTTLPPPDSLSIETVVSSSDLKDFVGAYAGPFGVPEKEIGTAIERETDFAAAPGRLQRFTGWVHGIAVASTTAYVAQGVLGIYTVATHPAFRGRGIATALTESALQFGVQHGMKIATLQASGMGAPVYRAMGFETVGQYRAFQLS